LTGKNVTRKNELYYEVPCSCNSSAKLRNKLKCMEKKKFQPDIQAGTSCIKFLFQPTGLREIWFATVITWAAGTL